MPAQPRGRDHGAERHVWRRCRRADHHAAADRAMAAGRTVAARIRRHRISSCRAIRSTITPPSSNACGCRSWAEFSRAVKTGATAGKVAATVVSRMERRTKTGNKMGIIGPVGPDRPFRSGAVFRGACRSTAKCWSRARPCCCSLARSSRARMSAPACCMPSRWMTPRRRPRRVCASFVRDTRPLDSIARRLQMPEAGGAGQLQPGRHAGETGCHTGGG